MFLTNSNFSSNALKYLFADFLWNLGRSLPHAILTVYLLDCGTTLTQIAFLQSIFMVVTLFSEFPSGVFADRFSRKYTYIFSIVLLLFSYSLIGFFSEHFIILSIAYVLYGLSIALKTGTLESEVILEYRQNNIETKHFSVANTYVSRCSSLIGGLLGSFLFNFMQERIYFISLSFFVVSIIVGLSCDFINTTRGDTISEKNKLRDDLKEGFTILKEYNILRTVLILSCLCGLFIQPFFQYWQVLYSESNIPVSYFGIIYVVFQLCGLLGAFIYKQIKESAFVHICIVISIPIICLVALQKKDVLILFFPVIVLLFYIFVQHIDVTCGRISPEKYMSSYVSLMGTVSSISSIISLFLMSVAVKYLGIGYAYLVMFLLFSTPTVFVIFKNRYKIYTSTAVYSTDKH